MHFAVFPRSHPAGADPLTNVERWAMSGERDVRHFRVKTPFRYQTARVGTKVCGVARFPGSGAVACLLWTHSRFKGESPCAVRSKSREPRTQS